MFGTAIMLLSAMVEGMRGFFKKQTLNSPSLEEYSIVKDLGSGAHGMVVLAKTCRKEKYAIKKVLTKELGDEKIALTVGWDNPYLVGLKESFAIDAFTFLVMEYAKGGNLKRKLQSDGKLSIDTVRMFSAEIAVGLQFLHFNNLVYRDLKPDNILIHKGHIKLSDFGQAKVLYKHSTIQSKCGIPSYTAPEVLGEKEYTYRVDWWSFGVVAYEMLLGTRPFTGRSQKLVIQSVLWGNVFYPPDLDPVAKQFIEGLLQKHPTVRHGWSKVKTHPFLDIVHEKDGKYYVPMEDGHLVNLAAY